MKFDTRAAAAMPLVLFLFLAQQVPLQADYVKRDTWRQTLVANLPGDPAEAIQRTAADFPDDALKVEIVADWLSQDGLDAEPWRAETLRAFLDATPDELGPAEGWGELYLSACEKRRAERFAPHREKMAQIVFTKHFDMGGSHYTYTEGQSDAQHERHFKPGSALCFWELGPADDVYGSVETLLEDPQGVIRDPDVSPDAGRVLFAWKKSLDQDDYHLYEMNLAHGQIRQITSGLGFADYEAAYLPNGDLIFTSSRCVQIVDCWWTEVSNLFTCDGDGRRLRQLSFDQVHDNYPTVTDDGRVIYTRWDYNDRGQIYPQGLFQIYQDGTGQTSLYGNNSFFPTTILHARSIPGTGKILCVFSGHHSRQKGWLGILQPNLGRQENQGAQLVAPLRETPAVHVDAYGQGGDQFQYPYPLSETEYLVTFRQEKDPHFGVYFMTIDGRRELLARDDRVSCSQPIPLASRSIPTERPSMVNYRKETGSVYLQDIYQGPGLAGIPRGTIKALRVVALEFRAAGVGNNGNSGPAGGALISTPISIQGAWDIKKVLGTATVHDDGSACFTVPARTPLYFQALDENGHMVQSMRSWTSLQPGESVSCVGCHENKNAAPPVGKATLAMAAGPQALTPFHGPPRGFSFVKEIQPILTKHCVRCHHLDQAPKYSAAPPETRPYDPATVRMLAPCEDASWRYTTERPAEAWSDADFDDSTWKYGPGGFGTAGTPGAAVGTEWRTSDIWIRREFELPPDFQAVAPKLLAHHDEDMEVYINGQSAATATGYVVRYGLLPIRPQAEKALKPGKNTLAAYCRQTGGGQFIDVGIVETRPEASESVAVAPDPMPPEPEDVKPMFSLRGIQTLDDQAQRSWSDSYMALANRNVCNWINVQSAPPMLPPYSAGASQSKLIAMLSEGHNGVKLTQAEMDRFVAWIDLLVPYAGDYTETMPDAGAEKYNHFLEKRRRWQAQEAKNIDAFLEARN